MGQGQQILMNNGLCLNLFKFTSLKMEMVGNALYIWFMKDKRQLPSANTVLKMSEEGSSRRGTVVNESY